MDGSAVPRTIATNAAPPVTMQTIEYRLNSLGIVSIDITAIINVAAATKAGEKHHGWDAANDKLQYPAASVTAVEFEIGWVHRVPRST
ncbi:MAG: hypothetical protein R3E01_20190 [Pirellulaceae bacterium]|nr:hypothetical protein [Planctomycetales bacterium]